MKPAHRKRAERPRKEGEGKSSEHGSSVNRIELFVNAATAAIGAIELIEKLIEVLTHR